MSLRGWVLALFGAASTAAGFVVCGFGVFLVIDRVFGAHRAVSGQSGAYVLLGAGLYLSGIACVMHGLMARAGEERRAAMRSLRSTCLSALSLLGGGGLFASFAMMISSHGADQAHWLIVFLVSCVFLAGGESVRRRVDALWRRSERGQR